MAKGKLLLVKRPLPKTTKHRTIFNQKHKLTNTETIALFIVKQCQAVRQHQVTLNLRSQDHIDACTICVT